MSSLRIINFLGKATLMVYLLHDNEFFYSLWKTEDWITLLYEDTAAFSGTYLLWILKTFAAGLICYILFLLVGKLLHILAPLAIKRAKPTEVESK